MKDRRIWVIIGCILVVGIAITSYTSSVVKKVPQEQKIQVLSETTAETAVDSDSAPSGCPLEALAKIKPVIRNDRGSGCRDTFCRKNEANRRGNRRKQFLRRQMKVQAADPPVKSGPFDRQNRNRKAIQNA